MKLDERLIFLFVRELALQCRQVMDAITLASGVYHDFPIYPFEDTGWHQDAWRRENERRTERYPMYIHAFLAHVGVSSKILWPASPRRNHPFTREQREDRAAAIRTLLGVADDSPLRDRAFRDHLEHLDERLEVWYQTPAGNRLDLFDLNTLPFGLSSREALVTSFREFGLGKFQFMGNTYEFGPVINAIESLKQAAEEWIGANAHILKERGGQDET